MPQFFRLLYIETLKLRRSSVITLVFVLPLVFIAIDFWFFRRPLLAIRQLSAEGHLVLTAAPIKIVAIIWAGLFQPLLLALLPALLVRPEHRFRLWKHLYSQPVPPRMLFFAKAMMLILLALVVSTVVELGLWAEGWLLGKYHPVMAHAFPWMELAKVFGWMFVGSLPLLALYLWLSHRVNHGAVPISLGLIGLVLSIALSRGDMNPPWQRDFIPWVLPYVCAQRAVERHEARQEVHLAAVKYRSSTVEEKILKDVKAGLTARQLPWVFPPPTPSQQLVAFSFIGWVMITTLGAFDLGRNRTQT